MKTRFASLQARLLIWGMALTAAGIVITGLVVGWVLERFVVGQIDGQLDARTAAIADILADRGVSGFNENRRSAYAPIFDRTHPGWFWQVAQQTQDGPQTIANSITGELLGPTGLGAIQQHPPLPAFDPVIPLDSVTRQGTRVHARVRSTSVDGRLYFVVAGAPRTAVLAAVWQLIWPVSTSMLVLGIALTLAITLQVRLGLKPLRRLEGDISQIRSGEARRLPAEQPSELTSLVGELNQLIEHNRLGLDAARRQVANLAHSLKTPLASIQLELENLEDQAKKGLVVPVEQIERNLRHHLSRARANTMSSGVRERVPLAPAVMAIVDALEKLFRERHLAFSVSIDAQLRVVCERRDLDEILGNVLENACKWAAERIVVAAHTESMNIAVTVEDDGPGVPDDRLSDILRPGERMDTTTRGDGFGLSIAQELIEIHAGSIELSRSPMGGLRVRLAFKTSQ